jgi:hypothetical protein
MVAAGGIEAALAALQAHPADAVLQAHGCQLLRLTADNERCARAVGAVEAVVSALRAHTNHVGVQDAGCGALTSLCMHADVQTAAERAGALPALLAALCAPFPLDTAGVHLSVCRALLYLICTHRDNVDKACCPEFIAALCAALRTRGGNKQGDKGMACALRVEACTVLSHLLRSSCVAGQLAAAAPAGADAVSAVLAAMRADPSERSLQRQGVCALRFLVADAASMAASRQAGAEAVLGAALGKHGDDLELRLSAEQLLALLQSAAAAAPPVEVVACSDVAHSVARMRQQPADALVQAACCGVLSIIVRSECDRAAVAAARGVSVLVAALRAHAADGVVQARACRALAAAIIDSAESIVCAVALGAIELAVAAMRTHLLDAEVQLAACAALSALRPAVDYAPRSAAAGAVSASVAALLNWPTHKDLQVELCSVFLIPCSEAEACEAMDAGVLPLLGAMLRARTEPYVTLDALHCVLLNGGQTYYLDQAARLGLIGAVVEAMRALPNMWNIQHMGLLILRITMWEDGARSAAHAAGAADVARAAQRAHSGNNIVHRTAAALLQELQPLATAAADAAMASLLAEEAAEKSAAALKAESASSKSAKKKKKKVLQPEPRHAGDEGASGSGDAASAAAPAQRATSPAPQAEAAATVGRRGRRVGAAGSSSDAILHMEDACKRADYAQAIAVLRAHADDAKVQADGCDILLNATLKDSTAQAAAVLSAGGVVAALAALRAHPAAARTQVAACELLSTLLSCAGAGACTDAIQLHGVLELYVAAMRAHPDDVDVQEAGCSAVSAVQEGDGFQQRAAAAGAVEAALAVLLLRRTDGEAHALAAAALAVMVRDNSANQRAAAGAVPALVPLLRVGAARSAALEALASVLAGSCGALVAEACRCGAVEAVVAAMRAKPGDAWSQRNGMAALLHLLDGHAANARAALRAGALAVVRAAQHAHVYVHRESAQRLSKQLLPILEGATAAAAVEADAAMAALLAEEEKEAAARGSTSAGKRKKDKQKGRAAAAAAAGAGGAGASGASGAAAQVEAAEAEAEAEAVPDDNLVAAAAPTHAAHAEAAVPPLHGAGDAAREPGDAGEGAGAAVAAGEAAPPQQPHAAPPAAWPGTALHAAAPPRTQAPRGAYSPPSGPPPSTRAGQAAAPPPQPQQPQFAQPPQLSPAEGMLLLPPYLAHLALGGAAPLQHGPAAAAPLPPPPLPSPLLPSSLPPPAAAEEPPPPVLRECCICMLDIVLEELFLLWPCAHRCVCGGCVAALRARLPHQQLCPKCRVPVQGASLVYDP